ncbi:MAG: hypothetical protein M3Z02_11265 [Actinomycetota bacterium]|nr:hypothetical protein [Actinomycetota bacterium]
MTDTTAPAATLTHDIPAVTLTDRCDRCGVQARVRVVLAGGGELMFCRHHANQYEVSLRERQAQISDEVEL